MFTNEFEKLAKFNIKEALKPVMYVGKSIGSAMKGVGEGMIYHSKRTADKFKKELPKLSKEWKGVKDPSSYAAVSKTLTKFTPEMLALGAGGYVLKKSLSPKDRKDDVPMGYY